MPESSYDKASRYLSKVAEEAMAHWWLGLGPEAVAFRSLEDSVVVLPKIERICDLIVTCLDQTRNGYPCAGLIEFQIQPDPEMFGRLLIAGGMVWMLVKPTDLPGDRYDLMAVVVNLTGRGNCSREMRIGTTRWALVVREINLEELDAEAVLTDIDAGKVPKEVMAFIPLMKKGGEAGIIDRWLSVARAEPDLMKRGRYALAMVFADAVGMKDLWERRLRGLDMIEAPIVTEWKVEAMGQTLLTVLEAKFAIVPEEIAKRIESSKDAQEVQRWVAKAATAPTLEQFRQDTGL